MNLKNVLGKVESGAQILKLEKIVQRRVEQYDREIDELILKLSGILFENEVVPMEKEVVERCLAKYDEEAVPFMGHALSANWREGGGDNLEVRKRMLLRELEKKKFKLPHAVEQHNKVLRADLRSYLEIADKFAEDTQAILPLPLEELRNHFFKLNQELDNLARRPTTAGANLSYADGHLAFDYAVRGELVKEMQTIFTRLEIRNEELTRQLHRERLQSYLNVLQIFEKDTAGFYLLPASPEKLNNHLETFFPLLESKVLIHYKEGYRAFDALVDGALIREINEAFGRLKVMNTALIAKKVDELKETTGQSAKEAVKAAIILTMKGQGKDLQTSVPEFIPHGVVAQILEQIEELEARLVSAI
jgi:hypothetical protein